jgi:hypothetical protein
MVFPSLSSFIQLLGSLRLGWLRFTGLCFGGMHLCGIYNPDTSKTREPCFVECENLSETVYLHRGHQPCIVRRFSRHAMPV